MDLISLFYIIAASIGWGTSCIFINILPDIGITTNDIALIRTTISAIIILAYIFFNNPDNFKIKASHLPLHIISGLSLYGTGAFYYAAIKETTVSVAVVLMYTAIIIVTIISALFLGEKLTPKKIIAILLTIVGCAFVTGLIGNVSFTPYGIFLGFMSSVSYSTYNIVTKIKAKKGINPLTSTAYCFIFAALTSMLISNPIKVTAAVINGGVLTILWAVGIAVITCTMPYLLYTLGLKKLPVGVASSLAIIEPMSASIFSVVFFNEQLNLYTITGIVLILSSVVLLAKIDNKHKYKGEK